MTMLNDVALLAADTLRARAYLHCLSNAKLLPATAIVIDNPNSTSKHQTTPTQNARQSTHSFDDSTPLLTALQKNRVPVKLLPIDTINDPRVVDAIGDLPQPYIIFAGPSGAIVRQALLDTGKRFLHVHPGRLPQYRGSTPMYYSLLNEGKMYATAIFLNAEIDNGPIIAEKQFTIPDNKADIDFVYDPWMRANLLVDVLQRYQHTGELHAVAQTADNEAAYYIIHPVLKHLAILSNGSINEPINRNRLNTNPR